VEVGIVAENTEVIDVGIKILCIFQILSNKDSMLNHE
jgi:hypothetical protein